MDAKLLRLAQKLGMKVETCVSCHQLTLWIPNEKETNKPMTCGRMECHKKNHEVIAIYEKWERK